MVKSESPKEKPRGDMTAEPCIILVEPQLGENIGAAARAMANFGLRRLRLVNPRDGWPNKRAVAASSGAEHVIEAAELFDDVASAVADLRFVFATTARSREAPKVVRGPEEAARMLRQRGRRGDRHRRPVRPRALGPHQ